MTMINDHGHITLAKTRKIPAGEFKARCLKLMDEVAETGEELVVTKRGKPVVKLVPISPKGKDFFGAMKGTATIQGDIIGPFFDDWALDDRAMKEE